MKTSLAALLLLAPISALAAPESKLWAYWNTSNPEHAESISHQAWQELLDKYLVVQGEDHLLRYGAFEPQDTLKLNRYIESLETLDPRQLRQNQQYAYWVNLYNAVTVKLIIDHYPVSSITKLGGLFSFGPWDQDVLTINGQDVTLNDIEHRILRPIWQDPRTHYAVNCASLGCPNLQASAFTAENTEALLEQAAEAFINSYKGAEIQGETLTLSSIYDWFAADFGDKEALFDHLTHYRAELAEFSGKIRYDYDWQLNERKE